MLPALVDCKLSQLLLIVNQRTVIILLLVGWDARLVLTTKLAKCVGARTSHWAMAIVIAQQVKSIAMWQSALLASLVLTGTKLLKNASVVLSTPTVSDYRKPQMIINICGIYKIFHSRNIWLAVNSLLGLNLYKKTSLYTKIYRIAIPVKMGFHAWLVRKTTHKHLQIYASVPLPTYTMWLVIVCHPVLKTSTLKLKNNYLYLIKRNWKLL